MSKVNYKKHKSLTHITDAWFYLFLQGIEIVSLDSHAILGRNMALQCRFRLSLNFMLLNKTYSKAEYFLEWFWTPQGSQLEHHLESLDSFKQLTGNQIISRTD